MSLKDIEMQAESNLRHSFSVVGLTNDMDDFFEMVDRRIKYVNMSNNVRDKELQDEMRHSTQKTPEHLRCKEQFEKNQTFQELLQEAIPPLKVMNRLYRVGVEVNAFQKRELEQCTGGRQI